MKIITLILLLCSLSSSILYSQNVAISTTNAAPNPSAMLDIVSTASGLLIPRMTTVQKTAISSPANGLMIFDTNLNCVYMYLASSSSWRSLCDLFGPYFVQSTTLYNPPVTNLLKTLNVPVSTATDKLLIEAEFDFSKGASAAYVGLVLYRNGVEIHEVSTSGAANADNSVKLTFVDIPGLVGTVVYTLSWYTGGGTLSTVYGSNLITTVIP